MLSSPGVVWLLALEVLYSNLFSAFSMGELWTAETRSEAKEKAEASIESASSQGSSKSASPPPGPSDGEKKRPAFWQLVDYHQIQAYRNMPTFRITNCKAPKAFARDSSKPIPSSEFQRQEVSIVAGGEEIYNPPSFREKMRENSKLYQFFGDGKNVP